MKINVANPITGRQKLYDIEDELKLRSFMEKRISQEVDASAVDDSLKGYVLRITGGNDKQGFPMMQGALTNLRVRLLLDGRTGCFRRPTHDGERKRRTVRGCITSADLSVINTVIVKKGPQEIAGLTDSVVPRRLGPKRASKIRKLFNLSKDDDVRKFVVRRTVTLKKPTKSGKTTKSKAPKIQRLVTSVTLKRKRERMNKSKKQFARVRAEAAQYAKMLEQRVLEAKKKRSALIAEKRTEAKKAREEASKAKTRQALKKIAQREAYAAKRRAQTAHTSRKLTAEQRKKAIKTRKTITSTRSNTLQRLIQMHSAAKRAVLRAKTQMAKFPSRQVLNHMRKVKQQRHELYLRIMSGGRLPNLKRQARHQAKIAAREAKRKATKTKRHQLIVAEARKPAAKKAKL